MLEILHSGQGISCYPSAHSHVSFYVQLGKDHLNPHILSYDGDTKDVIRSCQWYVGGNVIRE